MIPHRTNFRFPFSVRPSPPLKLQNEALLTPNQASQTQNQATNKRKMETGEICPVWNHRSSAPPGPLPKRKRQSLKATSIFEYRAFWARVMAAEQRNANLAATAAATKDPHMLMTPEELWKKYSRCRLNLEIRGNSLQEDKFTEETDIWNIN